METSMVIQESPVGGAFLLGGKIIMLLKTKCYHFITSIFLGSAELRDWLLPMLMNGQVRVNAEKGYEEGGGELGMVAEGRENYTQDIQSK